MTTADSFRCGHAKTEENSVPTKSGNGRTYMQCRECKNRRLRERRAADPVADRMRRAREGQLRAKARRLARQSEHGDTTLGPWVQRALCAGQDVNFFFPEGIGRRQAERRAADFCLDCPVMFECATYAVEAKIRHGVFGGLTTKERLQAHQ